tara:strand:- start:1089 stop:2024 length:936 start_codon:yes stop_codon:yes gene_type:complete
MAINVNTVYKTVLLILNQQQRGYITPDEFNKLGSQVQLGIFEGYMSDLNQQERVPQNDSEYANRVENIDEKIDIFKKYNAGIYVNPYFITPATSTTATLSNDFGAQAAGVTIFAIPGATATGWNTTFNSQIRVKVNNIYISTFTWAPTTGVNGTMTLDSATVLNDTVLVELYVQDFYRLGSVIYNDTIQAQIMNRKEWYLIKQAPLVAPTTSQPAFLYEDEKIYLYPTTIVSNINISYLRKPVDVTWAYSQGDLGQYIYNATSSTQFELHESEQTNVILQILSYSGVILQDPSIVQMAAQKVQQDEINEKS